jgi:3-deoxy-7-phosphoheptulonate synthase
MSSHLRHASWNPSAPGAAAAPVKDSSGPHVTLRSRQPASTVVHVGNVPVGGGAVVVMAGPCAVESADQLEATATVVSAAGAHVLRGGVYKPRTSPYAFQGLGDAGVPMLGATARRRGMPVVTEVMDPSQIELLVDHVDLLQVGTRNMQNFTLLRELGRTRKPVLLKRGFAATIKEWLLAAEYVVAGGNPNVILCERGIRTFETEMRFTLDLAAVALVKQRSHLPVLVDPSHSTGLRELVAPMSLAAIAAGADGLLVEVHPSPEHALCDGPQALLPDMFQTLMAQVGAVAASVGRALWVAPQRGDAAAKAEAS